MKFRLVESKADQQKLIDYCGEELARKFLDDYRRRLRPPYNDLYYWLKQPLQNFKAMIYKFEKKDGLIFEDEIWKVYKITSQEMLNNLTDRHIRWCIQNDIGWKDHVINKGTQFYLYINKLDNKKYLKGINKEDTFENGFWGENNLSIRDKAFERSLPKIS